MKKTIIAILSVMMLACFGMGLVACGEGAKTPPALAKPVISATGTELSWNDIENAMGYVLKINNVETAVTGTSYNVTNAEEGSYVCSVKAVGDGVNFSDSEFSDSATVKIEHNAPVINLNSVLVTVGAETVIELNETTLGINVTEESSYSLSYSVKYNGETEVELTDNQFETAENGFYTVDITATDFFDCVAVKRVNLVVLGTYLYSLDNVSNINEGSDWFVRNSSNGGFTPAEIVTEANGNKFYKLTALAGETTTFNMPLPEQNGFAPQTKKSYKVFFTLWTDAKLSGPDKIDVTSVAPMVNLVGGLNENCNRVVCSAMFNAEERLSTFYIKNNTANSLSYYIDNFMLIENPVWDKMPVDVQNGSDEVDENGNFKSVFSRADSIFNFYPEEIKDCVAGDAVKIRLTYKIVSDVPMTDNRGALGSYSGGTLFLTPNSNDYLTIEFDMAVDKGDTPNLQIVFITAKDAAMYIESLDVTVIPAWKKMPVDTARATDEVDENGNFKAVFSRADATFTFYPEEIKNLTAGRKVKVTLKYKILSEAAMADRRGALGSYNSGTLFLTANSQDFSTIEFDMEVDAGDKPNLSIVFITAVDAAMYIEDLSVYVYPVWSKMPVDVSNGTDEVDADGNMKSTFSDVSSKFTFYPTSISEHMAGDSVSVTLKYKIISDTAISGGATAMFNGGKVNLTDNTEDYQTITFDMTVEEGETPNLSITFNAVAGATLYIQDLTVVSKVPVKYGFATREVDLGLGGNKLYFLPSTTGMQSLSMVIQNTDGEIYIIDGGYDSVWGGNDAKLLYDLISDLCGKNDKVISGWFFSHPHEDHMGVFHEFVENYGSLVKIKTIYYSWSEDAAWYKQFTQTPDVSMQYVNAFKAAIPESTQVIKPKTGDVFNFGSFSFKILYSPAEDNYPFTGNEAYNFNNLSVVIKMTTSEKSVIFLGDAGIAAGEWLLKNCSAEDLKSDIVQMAHHGQSGVEEAVYKAIKPSVALFNCDKAVYENTNGNLKTLIVRGWLKALGATNYVAKDGIFIFS